ncbi:MAG: hypothetical protein J7577_13825 [Sphingobacteriaceae bacterium]|nr:hypothetical protein [Sphingobacteriaceae bacterium]
MLRNRYYILNYIFIVCVLILLVNDHYIKFSYTGWLSGKLSDVAGIIILPLIIAYIFPKLGKAAIAVSALLFLFWKSEFSQGMIDFYNQYSFIGTSRVIDYSDLLVFVFLPVPYYIIKHIDQLNSIKVKQINPLIVLIPSFAALIATSPPASFYYNRSNADLKCYNCTIKVNYPQDEILKKLKAQNIIFDSIKPLEKSHLIKNQEVNFYKLNQLVIKKDTLSNLEFTMRTFKNGKTKIYFRGMHISEKLSNEKLEKALRKYYKKLVFNEIKNRIKNTNP